MSCDGIDGRPQVTILFYPRPNFGLRLYYALAIADHGLKF